MPSEFTTGVGLDIIIWLQDHRNGWLDLLAELLHIFGKSSFFIVILTYFYWSVDKLLGKRLLFALLVGTFINTVLKELLQEPRPYQMSDEVTMLVDQPGYGFPSGHVMQVITVWGTAALHYRKRWLTWGVVVLTLLAGWARMVNGVHYPQDIVGGIVFGLLTLWALRPLWNAAAWFSKRTSLQTRVAGVFLAGLVAILFTYDNKDGMVISGMLWGAGFGVIVESIWVQFSAEGTQPQKLLRYVGGLVIVGGTLALLGMALPDDDVIWKVPTYAIVGFVAVAAWPAVWPHLARRMGW